MRMDHGLRAVDEHAQVGSKPAGTCIDPDLIEKIRDKLDVSITMSGKSTKATKISGPKHKRELARQILDYIADAAASGRSVSVEDLDTLIEKDLDSFRDDCSDPEKLFSRLHRPVWVRTETQRAYARSIFSNELNFGIGPAGTGKTYIAVAAAVSLYNMGQIEKIILSRPAVEAGERLGFLPGDMKEKVDPYMQPLYDALNDFIDARELNAMLTRKTIEIAPLAFMRGRTLSRAFVLLDEAQNSTALQMKMFLTRLGEGSRMVITGDASQVDLPGGVKSGLSDAVSVLKGVPGVSITEFAVRDVVRNPMVARVIQAYESREAERVASHPCAA